MMTDGSVRNAGQPRYAAWPVLASSARSPDIVTDDMELYVERIKKVIKDVKEELRACYGGITSRWRAGVP